MSAIGAGERVQFWWRDDDASAGSPALDRLLALSDRCGAPVSLAVIPHQLRPSLVNALRGRRVDVLVHGWKHKNRAEPDQPRSEYPLTRPRDEMQAELAKAADLLREALPEHALRVFVPPGTGFPRSSRIA